MKKGLLISLVCLGLASCQTPEGGVMNKVLTDFGIRQAPEGQVSESDKIFQNLGAVGPTEMKRMNTEMQKGQVKFQQESELKGKYYKEVKVYQSFYPVEVKSVSRAGENESGFDAYIEYAYCMYQSMRRATAVEAEAEAADIATSTTGRDRYRYHFRAGGEWDGAKGEKVKR